MASGPITSWQIEGDKFRVVTDFLFLGSKITADGDCSHEIGRWLPLGRKVMTNLDSVLKSSDVTLLTKVRIVKAVLFPGVIYGCESWTVKKAECRRIELWCWRRHLKVPWTARRSNQSILREINLEYSLEGLMLKLQYLVHLKTRPIGKVPNAGKDRGQKEKRASEDEMAGWHHWCNEHEHGQTLGDGEGQGGLACCSPWGHKVSDTTGWLSSNNMSLHLGLWAITLCFFIIT